MKKSIIALALLTTSMAIEARELVWSDEFNVDGPLDERYWNYENGFVRNHEEQWYQRGNAYCRDGMLVIEARCDSIVNPDYQQGATDWRRSRPVAAWSSASVNTAGKVEFTYGSMEVRARIPVGPGAWPAIWTLGRDMVWPSCGEIDVMEYYLSFLHISEPTGLRRISYAVFCLKKKNSVGLYFSLTPFG